MIGSTISHYKILSDLGQGGMGVVYKAEDTKLRRTVALKFLPIDKLEGEEEKARFLREGQAAAALNHPNICTIHEIDEADGHSFIAMEFVEGQSVKQRIRSRPLKLEEALDIAVQVGQGLQVAHQNAVVHRDIKSSNVMVTAQGLVKVMDFGLAQLGDRSKLTRTGSTLGTPSYMSPEQAQGQPTDRRSDIWSLGVVLYEMVSGQLPFKGEVEAAVTYAILNAEPEPLTALRSGLPIELDRVITKALAKAPDERYQHVEEMLVDLRALKKKQESGEGRPVRAPAVLSRGSRAGWYVAAAVAAIALIAVAGAWMGLFSPAPEAPLAGVPLTSYAGSERDPSFSPDGNQVAFSWDGENQDNYDIYVQLVGSGSPLRLTTNPAPDYAPAWSLDGRNIAFVRRGEEDRGISLVSPLGGPERQLSEGPPESDSRFRYAQLSWSPDGKLLAFARRSAPEQPSQIVLLSVDSGETRALTSAPAEWPGDSFPAFSPDGQSLPFARSWDYFSWDVYVAPLTGDESTRLTTDGRSINGLAWSPDGGKIVYSSSAAGYLGGGELWRVSVSGGSPQRFAAAGANATYPSVARQGNRLAYVQTVRDENIWRVELDRPADGETSEGKLIASTRNDRAGRISPDGKRITFVSDRSGSREIWVADSDGANLIQVTNLGAATGGPRWSPDGRRIAFDSTAGGTGGTQQSYTINVGGGSPRMITSGGRNRRPEWSTDGLWVYYSSSLSGESQVWKFPAAGGEPVQVTRQGGSNPIASPNGKFVYFERGRGRGRGAESGPIWRIPAEGGEEKLVTKDNAAATLQGCWAVLADGVYFVDLEEDDSGSR